MIYRTAICQVYVELVCTESIGASSQKSTVSKAPIELSWSIQSPITTKMRTIFNNSFCCRTLPNTTQNCSTPCGAPNSTVALCLPFRENKTAMLHRLRLSIACNSCSYDRLSWYLDSQNIVTATPYIISHAMFAKSEISKNWKRLAFHAFITTIMTQVKVTYYFILLNTCRFQILQLWYTASNSASTNDGRQVKTRERANLKF